MCAGKALSVPEQTQPIHADKKIKIKNTYIYIFFIRAEVQYSQFYSSKQ